MSHFDSTVVIGKSVGGGGGPREKVIRGASALNRAQRQGGVTTTKNQFLAVNSAATSINGQRVAAIANNPDIVKPKAKDGDLQQTFRDMATALGLKQDEFARTANIDPKKVFPKANDPAVTEDTINKIQAFYGMYVKGDLKGTRHGKPMKARAYRAKLASKFPGLIEEGTPAAKPAATKPAAQKP